MRIKEILAEDSALDLKSDIKSYIDDDLDGLSRLGNTIRFYIDQGDTPLPKLAKVVDKFKDEILEFIIDNYDYEQAEMIGALERLNLHWPELAPIKEEVVASLLDDLKFNALQFLSISPELIENIKSEIISDLLYSMKHGHYREPQETIKWLRAHKISWPELDIIQKSLNYEKEK